ncbi:MAG: dihydrolipoamide acetyltransferase, partial [Polyangiales bacterium]
GYGIFSYLQGYKFEVRSSRSFTAMEGKTISLRVIGYEQGGPTTPLEERPAIRYIEKLTAGVAQPGAAAPAAKAPETK